MASEQEALRRVATLIAQEIPQPELCRAIAEEIRGVLGTEEIRIFRFEGDRSAVVIGSAGSEEAFPVGSRHELQGNAVAAHVFETGRTARIDDYKTANGPLAESARAIGVRAVVGAPVNVGGELWGVVTAGSTDDTPPPSDAESRLAQFTELIAIAIANGEARTQLQRLAEERAALLRLATLVADGVPAHEIFSAVSDELAQLFAAGGLVLRFEEDGTGIVSVGVSTGIANQIPVGVHWDFEEGMASLEVYRGGSSARVDAFDWQSSSGPAVETAERVGIVSSVSNPILVQGRLWGAITVLSTSERLPDETEERLEKFAQLVATALANAEGKAELALSEARSRNLADEQAALRRVATLAAQGVEPAELFTAVTKEVARVFSGMGDPLVATVIRFDPGPECVLAGASRAYEGEPVGSRWEPKDLYVSTRVLRTGRSARVNETDLEAVGGPDAEVLRRRRFLYQVGSPVVVEGRLWGAMTLNSSAALPPDADESLEKFTELVATSIANAESRSAREQLADEQAALRRVATLVAERASTDEIVFAVAREVGALPGVELVAISRFEPDSTRTLVAGWGDPELTQRVGTNWPLTPEDSPSSSQILETGRSLRVDLASDQVHRWGPAGGLGVRSYVGSPIGVEGRVWGALFAMARTTLPRDTEHRLADFTELVATAIANAESRRARERLADEQAALRRVATLVAQGAQPDKVFLAVSEEVRRLFRAGLAAVGRVEPDGQALNFVRPDGGHERVELADLLASAEVFRTGRSARADASLWESGEGGTAERLRSLGIVSIVSSPIVVGGEVSGIINVGSTDEVLPPDTEERLERFTEIVATAIANADSRQALARLADEQAALRRVATLVARDAPSTEVFDAVATEVGKLLDTDITVVGRYDGDGAATAIGSWSASPGGVPVGTRSVLGGHNVLTLVAETGRPARVDGYDDASGEAADIARRHGWSSSVAAPIVVEDRLWGVMLVATTRPEPFPAGAEERLAAFTDLIATALANAQSHDEVRRFGDEQASLRRVATLVAEGATPTELFSAVAIEVAEVVGVTSGSVSRFLPDGSSVVLASHNDPGFPVGSRWQAEEGTLNAAILRGQPARIDQNELRGPIAEASRLSDVRSVVGAPIVVEGSVWGMVAVGEQHSDEALPPETEMRLGGFTELIATAIANAESRDALAGLADEQTALRRIATLVARGVPSEELFAAVAEEVQRLFGLLVAVSRYEADGSALIVGAAGNHPFPVGTRWPLDGPSLMSDVHRTGRAARIDDYSELPGTVASVARQRGVRAAIGAPVVVGGETWGLVAAISADDAPIPEGAETKLAGFTELVATAVSNAAAGQELAASRRRIVTASDETRRQIERDLHDGTQQRLVSLGLAVRAAEANLPPERDDLRSELSNVAMGLAAAVEDLQELSRGIHPAILSKGGLGPTLETLAHRSAIPVVLDVTTDARFAEPIEVAAYFVASEALANAAKHSEASRIDVSLEQRDSTLVLSVRDDGVGGADADGGSGLVGLRDRVEALGGSISVASRQGNGTRVTAELPVEPALPPPA